MPVHPSDAVFWRDGALLESLGLAGIQPASIENLHCSVADTRCCINTEHFKESTVNNRNRVLGVLPREDSPNLRVLHCHWQEQPWLSLPFAVSPETEQLVVFGKA